MCCSHGKGSCLTGKWTRNGAAREMLRCESIVRLLGTPTTIGNFSFTITATDANGCPGSEDYAMLVGAPPQAIPALSAQALALLGFLATRRFGA